MILSNCFNKAFINSMVVTPVLFNQVSITKGVQCFLFDSNTINKDTLNFLAEKHLHGQEILTLHKRKKPQAKQEFIISRILIKLLFIQNSNKSLNHIEIKFNDETLQLELFYIDKRQPLSISLSHSKGLILIALSLSNLSFGVDIEHLTTKRDVNLLAKNFYHSTEIDQIKQRGTYAFYRIWTLKEAVSKHLNQPIVTTLKQDIFKIFPLFHCQSAVHNDFDLSFVGEKSENVTIDNSVNLFSCRDFLNLFNDTTNTD